MSDENLTENEEMPNVDLFDFEISQQELKKAREVDGLNYQAVIGDVFELCDVCEEVSSIKSLDPEHEGEDHPHFEAFIDGCKLAAIQDLIRDYPETKKILFEDDFSHSGASAVYRATVTLLKIVPRREDFPPYISEDTLKKFEEAGICLYYRTRKLGVHSPKKTESKKYEQAIPKKELDKFLTRKSNILKVLYPQAVTFLYETELELEGTNKVYSITIFPMYLKETSFINSNN